MKNQPKDMKIEYGIMATMLIGAIGTELTLSMVYDKEFLMIVKDLGPISLEDVAVPSQAWLNLFLEDDDDITDELMHQWIDKDPRANLSYFYMIMWADQKQMHALWMAIMVKAWKYDKIKAIHKTVTGDRLFQLGVLIGEEYN